jgi:hypothetical protein
VKCSWVNVGGVEVVVCGRIRFPRCSFCGAPAGLECDWPIDKKKTCDKKLCRACAIAPGKNVDFCPDHPVPVQAQLFAGD